jgi:hypothetical protein
MSTLMALPTRTTRVICVAAVIVLASCSVGWAQPAAADPSFERMRAKLKVGDRLTVDLLNGSSVEGRVIDGSPDGLVLSTDLGDRRLSRPDIGIVRRHGHGVILGAIIGTGVGLTCGALLGTMLSNEGHDKDPAVFGLTLIGLGAGVGIDALANIPRTVYRQSSPPRTTLHLEAGPRRTAVRVVVAF